MRFGSVGFPVRVRAPRKDQKSSMNKLISVIIPAYNEEKLIEKTLISLKNQRYKPIELIVVDNNSTDKTAEIARKYADKVLFLKKKGASLSRNFGAENAKGEYLFFLDADSRLSQKATLKAVENMDKGYAGGTVKVIYENDSYKVKFIENIQNFCLEKWQVFETESVWTRKETFEKAGGYREPIKFGENMDLLKRLSKIGKLKHETEAELITSARRFLRNRDYLYAILGGFLILNGVKNLPFYAVRGTEEIKERKFQIKNILTQKIAFSSGDWKFIWNILKRKRFKKLFEMHKKFFNRLRA
jgi:glycosyltransferase involved in cell wall biosynthesis